MQLVQISEFDLNSATCNPITAVLRLGKEGALLGFNQFLLLNIHVGTRNFLTGEESTRDQVYQTFTAVPLFSHRQG